MNNPIPLIFIGLVGLLSAAFFMLYASGGQSHGLGTYEVALLVKAEPTTISYSLTNPKTRLKWKRELRTSDSTSNILRESISISSNDSYLSHTEIHLQLPTTNEKRTILYLRQTLPLTARSNYFQDETWLLETFSNGTGIFVSNQTHYDLWLTKMMEPLLTPKAQNKKLKELENLKALLETK